MSKLEYVELRVKDIGEAVAFNKDLLGLNEISRDGKVVFLGAGLDQNFDVGLVPGGAGIANMALSVNNGEELAEFEDRIKAAGLGAKRRTNGRPGVVETVSTSTPNGIGVDIVVLEKPRQYLHPAAPASRRGRGIGPRDLDHVNLLAGDVPAVHAFFTEALGLLSSDLVYPEGVGKPVAAAWMRVGEYHHDVAVMPSPPEQTLHHVAWTVDSYDHMKTAADLLAQDGITLEWGPGRHGIGGNLSMYFQVPGGNRYELCCEMGRVQDPSIPPGIWDNPGLSSWGQVPADPDAFWQGT
jgi:catechol 2,3-dioxygenase